MPVAVGPKTIISRFQFWRVQRDRACYLVVMRSCNQNHRPITRNVKGTTRPYFAKEDVDDELPKDYGGIVSQMGGMDSGGHL